MKIFYHGADNDGKLSGFWVNECAEQYDNYERELIPIDYGMEFPFDKIGENEQVYIVDYSIFPDEMRRLLDITKDIVWIDHHASAIKRYEGFEHEIAGIRYDGIAACMLTWCWFHTMHDPESGAPLDFAPSETQRAPLFTKYVADYDVWKFEFGDDTKAFQMGLQLYNLDPRKYSIWDEFLILYDYEKFVIGEGKLLIKYRDNWAKEYCEHTGYEVVFEGYKCFALNLAMISSEHFKSIDQDKYDLLIGFSYNGKSWNYSLRSTKVDCSQLAMEFGGGGHKGAAGFSSDEFLLK